MTREAFDLQYFHMRVAETTDLEHTTKASQRQTHKAHTAVVSVSNSWQSLPNFKNSLHAKHSIKHVCMMATSAISPTKLEVLQVYTFLADANAILAKSTRKARLYHLYNATSMYTIIIYDTNSLSPKPFNHTPNPKP